MLNSSWARLPTPTEAMALGSVVAAAVASIAAVPASAPNMACVPSVVHFIAEPKPLTSKPVEAASWPVLERLAPPYAEEAEAPQPALIQEAMNSAPVAVEMREQAPSRRRRARHHWR